MKKLESLVKKFDAACNKVSEIAQAFEAQLVFDGFEKYGGKPSVTYSSDGLIIYWGEREMFADEIVSLMNQKGYICPQDFGE